MEKAGTEEALAPSGAYGEGAGSGAARVVRAPGGHAAGRAVGGHELEDVGLAQLALLPLRAALRADEPGGPV